MKEAFLKFMAQIWPSVKPDSNQWQGLEMTFYAGAIEYSTQSSMACKGIDSELFIFAQTKVDANKPTLIVPPGFNQN